MQLVQSYWLPAISGSQASKAELDALYNQSLETGAIYVGLAGFCAFGPSGIIPGMIIGAVGGSICGVFLSAPYGFLL